MKQVFLSLALAGAGVSNAAELVAKCDWKNDAPKIEVTKLSVDQNANTLVAVVIDGVRHTALVPNAHLAEKVVMLPIQVGEESPAGSQSMGIIFSGSMLIIYDQVGRLILEGQGSIQRLTCVRPATNAEAPNEN